MLGDRCEICDLSTIYTNIESLCYIPETNMCRLYLTLTKNHKAFSLEGKGIQTFFFFFLGPYLQHMEVPRLGVKSELHQPAYTTGTEIPGSSHICNLHHGSRQCRILNPLNKTRDRTCILTDDRFVSAEPQWELQKLFFGRHTIKHNYY